MKITRSLITLLCLLAPGVATPALAQTSAAPSLVLLSPMDYQVFQRQTEALGQVIIETAIESSRRGALTNLEKLEARLVGRSTDAGDLPGKWETLPFDNRVRRYRAELPVPAGGWYRFEVRLVDAHSNTVATATAEHVGVGEVFLVAGQSNAANHGEERQVARNPRVVSFGDGHWQPSRDPQPGASGTNGSFLPAFGDSMAIRLRVPVATVAIAVGATSVREWLPKGEVMAAPPSTGKHAVLVAPGVWVSTGELYDKLVAMEQVLGTNGFRAVLWHQGESDTHQAEDYEISPRVYHQYLQQLIQGSRHAAGWRVPWFVALVSYRSPSDMGSPELRAAQMAVVTEGLAFAGPDTDDFGPRFREKDGQGIHFNSRGLHRHGIEWASVVAAWLEPQFYVKPPMRQQK